MRCPYEILKEAQEAQLPAAEMLDLISEQVRRFGGKVDRSGWANLTLGQKIARIQPALDGLSANARH